MPVSHHKKMGVEVIKEALKTMPSVPGVYRMINAKGEVLYVGKAISLKKRVTSYTQPNRVPTRIWQMVMLTARMEIVTTDTEAQALLLEANYIKRMKPRFNILMRDDKSYPWIKIDMTTQYPRLTKFRGNPNKRSHLWGPFASTGGVNQTLRLLQRVFFLRTCSDTVCFNRSRPCLLYQIKRCSAPCVGRISEEDYVQSVKEAEQFLDGKDDYIHKLLSEEMQTASHRLDFERAAVYRDRIRALANMQGSNVVNPSYLKDADVFAFYREGGCQCIQVFFIRGGRNNGSRSFFPAHVTNETAEHILYSFIAQFYDNKPCPNCILTSHIPEEKELLERALSFARGKKIRIITPQRGRKKELVTHTLQNAYESVKRRLAETIGQKHLLEGVAKLFHLPAVPKRIESYDNSHIQGSFAYGVMVVAGPQGFDKRAYRKFRIKHNPHSGDDFAMMHEVLQRRFTRALKEKEDGDSSSWPDVLLIDGGLGQFNAVKKILEELHVKNVKLVAIAKGPERNAGREWFFTDDQESFQLPKHDPVLHFMQRLRDEAHRFAITTHRSGRGRALDTSELDGIPGIGAGRKKILLNRFGSARGVKYATMKELQSVNGINQHIAKTIYVYFHGAQ